MSSDGHESGEENVDVTLGYARDSYSHPSLEFGGISVTPMCQKELCFTDAMALIEGTADMTGQLVWKGSQLAAHWVTSNRAVFENGACVELGCGAGLVSAVLAKCGAASVYATDGDVSATRLAQANSEVQGLEKNVKARDLRWGDDAAAGKISDEIEAEMKGDSGAGAGNGVRLVIAAEVVYDGDHVDGLLQTAAFFIDKSTLSKDGFYDCPFVLSHAPRGMKNQKELDNAIVVAAEKYRFTTEIVDHSTLPSLAAISELGAVPDANADSDSGARQLTLPHFGDTKLFIFRRKKE